MEANAAVHEIDELNVVEGDLLVADCKEIVIVEGNHGRFAFLGSKCITKLSI